MVGPYLNGYGSSRDANRDDGWSRSRERLPDNYNGSEITRNRGGPRRKSHTSSSRSRSRHRGGMAEQQIEDVLQLTRRDWSSMTGDDCIPTQTALQLLDPSSLGLGDRFQEFYDANQQLQSALRAIVNEHYQGFNSSIGIYHQINANIQASQARIGELKQALVDSKASLTSTKSEVSNLVSASRDFEINLDVISRIEQIQAIPDVLEARISEKRFISAVDALQEGLRLVQLSPLDTLDSLSDTKAYMLNQEQSLSDILVEELHNHLYLKSPYCEQRWIAYAKLYSQSDALTANETKIRDLYEFFDRVDTSQLLLDDSAKNPEADSFQYIYTVVESIHKLGRLESTVEEIEERLPVELYRILDRTSAEIQQKYPTIATSKDSLEQTAADADDSIRDNVLNDLLGTLYAKFEAIAEAYRAFYEVVEGICRRENRYDTTRMTRSFGELWKLYQSEIRSLLHDYLATDGGSTKSLQGRTEENVFRQQRDRSKKSTFRMDWLDTEDAGSKAERDDFNALWQKQVPGLNSLTATAKSVQDSTMLKLKDTSSSGHKLLVVPSVFNVTCLLPPSVLFLRRLKELVPTTSDIVISTLSSFLNDFLINVFHPQLEEAITDDSSQTFLQADAFYEDSQWAQHADKPIFRGSVKFFDVISRYCRLLANLTHDQLFSQLVITQMNNYYDKCCSWYKTSVTRAQPKANGEKIKFAASLAWEGDLCNTVIQIREQGNAVEQSLIEQETAQLITALAISTPDEPDILAGRKSQASLCLLYTSMKWLASRIALLRRVSSEATDQTGMDDDDTTKPQLKRSLTRALINAQDPIGITPAYLPLSQRTASLFDGIVAGFEQLSDVVLRTLRLELRFQVSMGFRNCFSGSFIYSDVADAPNEDIVRMLTDVLEFNQEMESCLATSEHQFVTRGIGKATDALFVQGAVDNLQSINKNGSAHMHLNIQVLHHSLLVIEPSCTLPRSNALFDLFDRGPDAMIAAAHNNQSDSSTKLLKRQYGTLLRLWYSEKMESDRQEEAVRARQSLEEKLAQLDEVKD